VLIAEGSSNLDIAGALSISPNSVKAHIRSGYRKLGVATRAQAVRAVLVRDMVRRPRATHDVCASCHQRTEVTTGARDQW
jgi:hypothetical protein